jgi:hypothetical protein
MARGRLVLSAAAAAVAAAAPLPMPLALWTFQEPTGAPRLSSPSSLHPEYALLDGNASNPVPRVDGGLFGPHAAYFPADGGFNNSQRLFAPRAAVPALAAGIAGPNATVTFIAWVRRNASDALNSEGMVAGVWDEYAKARQYALFTDLGACDTAPAYDHGLAAHVSATGGPTPGQKYCVTRACDPRPLPAAAWHCLANVYDPSGAGIAAYVNGTLRPNGGDNPFAYPLGVFSPEAAGVPGAEFGVGANRVNETVGGPPRWSNRWTGTLGGLAVWAQALSQAQVAAACALPGGAAWEGLS